jgi:hypothetical protein
MSGQIAQELQNNPQAMQRIAPLVQQAMQGMQQPMQQRQPMPQQMQQPMQAMGMSNMGYNPFMAIQQMQRQPAQAQNPFFGGSIPMQFGLPQINQVPMGYVSPLAGFRPGDFAEFKRQNQNFSNNSGGFYNPNLYDGGANGSEGSDGNASASDMGGEDV